MDLYEFANLNLFLGIHPKLYQQFPRNLKECLKKMLGNGFGAYSNLTSVKMISLQQILELSIHFCWKNTRGIQQC